MQSDRKVPRSVCIKCTTRDKKARAEYKARVRQPWEWDRPPAVQELNDVTKLWSKPSDHQYIFGH